MLTTEAVVDMTGNFVDMVVKLIEAVGENRR